MPLLIERYLERQNGEHLVDISFDGLDAPFLPRPNLGRDVIVDRNARFSTQIFGYTEIKARIVNEYYHVGLPANNISLAQFHVLNNRA